MRSKLVSLQKTGASYHEHDLDALAGSRDKSEGIRIGPPGSAIPLHDEPDIEAKFDWSRRDATWRLSNTGRKKVSINNSDLEPGKSRLLIHTKCLLKFGDSSFSFLRTPSPPMFNGQETRQIPIPKAGLKIGRNPVKNKTCRSDTLELDLEIGTISSNQAEIVREQNIFYLENRNMDLAGRTRLNGSQDFDRRELVFGDVIQIPGYDYYSFQFIGDSLIHVGASSAIQARKLTRVAQHGRRILADVNIDLEGGDFVGVLGGSGQGKSTLMKALCGVEPATTGEVWVEGRRIASAREMSEMGLGYVPQDDIVHKELTVYDALAYSTKLRISLPKPQLKKALSGVLETLGLTEHQHKTIRLLSGGQRKRVSIASELILNPKFLFLDEPTSGLDPETESDLMEKLSDLARKQRMGILCTTHILERGSLFSSIVFVHGGRVIFHGKPLDAASYFLLHSHEADGDSRAGRSSTRGSSHQSTSTHEPGDSRGSRSQSDYASRGDLLSALPRLFRGVTIMVKAKESAIKEKLGEKESGESLSEQTARELEESFHASGFFHPLAPVSGEDSKSGALNSARKKPWILRTLQVLIARQWRILTSDHLNWLFLLAQALAIGFLVGWVSENLVFQGFISVVATLWFGCSNGAQQIVGELPIFRRERLAGVGLNVYIISKLMFLSAVTSVQALILFLTVLCTHYYFHPEVSPEMSKYHFATEWNTYENLFFTGVQRKPSHSEASNSPEPQKARTDGAHDGVDPSRVEGFELVGEEPAPRQPQYRILNPTGLQPQDAEFSRMAGIAWFFRIKQNALDTLGCRQIAFSNKTPDGSTSWVRFFGTLLGLRFGALLAAAVCGVSLGLMISATVRSETQAVMWVPLILIPQILFGGFVVTSPEMMKPVRMFSQGLPSYNVQRIMDTSHVYGRALPMMSTKTKIPAFQSMTPYNQDSVWGIFPPRRFDRVSDANKSWQNLAVDINRLGMWHLTKEEIIKNKDFREERSDVIFEEGERFILTHEAARGASILGGWVALSYVCVLFGLYKKQTGR